MSPENFRSCVIRDHCSVDEYNRSTLTVVIARILWQTPFYQLGDVQVALTCNMFEVLKPNTVSVWTSWSPEIHLLVWMRIKYLLICHTYSTSCITSVRNFLANIAVWVPNGPAHFHHSHRLVVVVLRVTEGTIFVPLYLCGVLTRADLLTFLFCCWTSQFRIKQQLAQQVETKSIDFKMAGLFSLFLQTGHFYIALPRGILFKHDQESNKNYGKERCKVRYNVKCGTMWIWSLYITCGVSKLLQL